MARNERKQSCLSISYYPTICLLGWRKIQDLNLGPPEHKTGVLITCHVQ